MRIHACLHSRYAARRSAGEAWISEMARVSYCITQTAGTSCLVRGFGRSRVFDLIRFYMARRAYCIKDACRGKVAAWRRSL